MMMSYAKQVWQVPDMECEGCAHSIRRSLGGLDGIAEIEIEVEAKRVSVAFDPDRITEEMIRDRIVKAGFTPSSPS